MVTSRASPSRSSDDSAAEALVASMLERQGWTIVARNYRRVGCELDLAASKGQTMIVVEVKAREHGLVTIEDAAMLIGRRKREALVRGAIRLATEQNVQAQVIRFDLALVAKGRVEYFVQVFDA